MGFRRDCVGVREGLGQFVGTAWALRCGSLRARRGLSHPRRSRGMVWGKLQTLGTVSRTVRDFDRSRTLGPYVGVHPRTDLSLIIMTLKSLILVFLRNCFLSVFNFFRVFFLLNKTIMFLSSGLSF